MRNLVWHKVVSFSSVAIAVGVVGFVSSIVTLFINIEMQISVKWLLAIVVIFSSILLIMLKLIYDVSRQTTPPPSETPIRYLPDEQIFVIRRNVHFMNHIIVGCYEKKDEIDRLAYLGVVHLVQDRIIQVKIRKDLGIIKSDPISRSSLNDIEIRPVVPTTAFEHYDNREVD